MPAGGDGRRTWIWLRNPVAGRQDLAGVEVDVDEGSTRVQRPAVILEEGNGPDPAPVTGVHLDTGRSLGRLIRGRVNRVHSDSDCFLFRDATGGRGRGRVGRRRRRGGPAPRGGG